MERFTFAAEKQGREPPGLAGRVLTLHDLLRGQQALVEDAPA